VERERLTVVMVTHDASLAGRGSRRVELVDGRVAADAPEAT
jgi:predicted ABC-type transport system involved in lysophospholipase L1 biosynthesis ATPase subunit